MSEPKKPISFWKIAGYSIAASVFVAAVVVALIPQFVRARTYSGGSCIRNLRMIEAAKQQWAWEHHKETNAIPTKADAAQYLKGNLLPRCPKGGNYTIGHVGENPNCTIPDHVLPTP